MNISFRQNGCSKLLQKIAQYCRAFGSMIYYNCHNGSSIVKKCGHSFLTVSNNYTIINLFTNHLKRNCNHNCNQGFYFSLYKVAIVPVVFCSQSYSYFNCKNCMHFITATVCRSWASFKSVKTLPFSLYLCSYSFLG